MNELVVGKKKRAWATLMVVLCILCFAGCKQEKKSNVTTKQLIDSVGNEIAKDQGVESKDVLNWNEVDLMNTEGEPILSLLELDKDTLEEGICYENPSSTKADRILIIKVKEKKDINSVKLALDKMKKTQETEVGQVLKEEEGKVKGGVVYVKDNYVVYIVYDNPAIVKKVIDDAVIK